ncbi:hypothetical protein C4546_04080 [Candidatus Parcubacteria bacterium]|jgi:hypothetical protein|nr:MAG: hypothetical protein C4546_04080 [Candidatus Parcubacteria bacterium]
MSLKKYLIIFTSATLISWGAWAIVFTQLNPETNRLVSVTAFAVSLGFAVAGTLSLLGFAVRAWFGRDPVLFRVLRVATRQGVIVAVFMEALLALQAMRWLAWWNVVPLGLFFTLLEGFFLAQDNVLERQTR